MPLRGRDAELVTIRESMDRVGAGRTSVVVIEGAPGLGKSSLLAQARELAGHAGIPFLSSGGDVDDRLRPFGPLTDALAPLLSAGMTSQLDQQWAALRLAEALEGAGPVVVCLDDLQWADSGTLEVLRVLPTETMGLPVAWLLAYRPGQAPARLLRLGSELVSQGAVRLELNPLSDEACEQVAVDILGSPPDAIWKPMLDSAAGNPFLLTDLLTGLRDEGYEGIPANLALSLRERLEQLPANAQRVAEAGAVLGRSFRYEEVAELLTLTAAQLIEPVGALLRADLLVEIDDRLAFRHDLVREAVLAGLPLSARRAVGRQAARVLAGRGHGSLELADRFATVADRGDELAISTLQEAAGQVAGSDPGTAGDLLRAALALTADSDPRRASFVAQTTVLLHAAGRDAEARDFADRALRQVLPPAAQAEVRLSVAQLYSLPADLRAEEGRAALALPGLPGSLRARHLATLVLSLAAGAQLQAARAAAAEAEKALAGDRLAELHLEFGLLALDEAGFDYAAMPGRIARIRQLGAETGDLAPVFAADWFRSSQLAHVDRLDDALTVAQEGLVAAERDQQAWIAPRWDIWRGWVLLQHGRLSDASAALEGAFTTAGLDLALALPDATGLAALGRVAIAAGDLRLTRKCADIARATLAVGAYDDGRRHLAWLLAQFALARGDAAAARHELLTDVRPGTSILPVISRDTTTEPTLVRLAIAAGDADLASYAVNEAEQRAAKNPDVATIQGVAKHARGLKDQDPKYLRTAAAHLEVSGRPLALAAALEDLSGLLPRAEAGVPLGRAYDLFRMCGAEGDAERVAGLLRDLGSVRPAAPQARGWASLSRSEMAVAELIGTGLTNRQAAERMALSQHTVNTLLRRVFVKLGIHTRAELARIASTRGP